MKPRKLCRVPGTPVRVFSPNGKLIGKKTTGAFPCGETAPVFPCLFFV